MSVGYILNNIDAAVDPYIKVTGPASVGYFIGNTPAAVDFYIIQLSFAADLTTGRARALVGAVVALISLVIGGLALARSAGRIGSGSGRAAGVFALLLGLIGVFLSVVHLGSSTGGFGSGGGRAGAIVALVLGLIGMTLGGVATARSRRSRGTD